MARNMGTAAMAMATATATEMAMAMELLCLQAPERWCPRDRNRSRGHHLSGACRHNNSMAIAISVAVAVAIAIAAVPMFLAIAVGRRNFGTALRHIRLHC